MTEQAIVITGMGAVTPIGIGVPEYWERLVAGDCGIAPISRFDASGLPVQIAAEVKEYDPARYLSRDLTADSDPFMQYAYIAASEALGQTLPAAPERTGIVMGTAMSGISTIAGTQAELTRLSQKKVSARFVPNVLGNVAAAKIAIKKQICGPSMTLSTACSSGADAIMTAAMLLLCGEADAVVAVGSESILCPLMIHSLSNARALSRHRGDPRRACRPYDKNRDGFVIGEGGGAVIVETAANAAKRGAPVLAELAGWANNGDAFHVSRPREDGAAAAACMAQAIRRAGLQPEQIDYVNGHGTGTKDGDAAELAALHSVFGSRGVMVSSTKGATGHMMGAGGITEVIACIKALETGLLPPTLNLEEPDEDRGLDLIRGAARRREISACVSNAFGFGGQNASLVLKKPK